MSASWEYAMHSMKVASHGGPEAFVKYIEKGARAAERQAMKKVMAAEKQKGIKLLLCTNIGSILLTGGIVYFVMSTKKDNNHEKETILEGEMAQKKFIDYYNANPDKFEELIRIIEKNNS